MAAKKPAKSVSTPPQPEDAKLPRTEWRGDDPELRRLLFGTPEENQWPRPDTGYSLGQVMPRKKPAKPAAAPLAPDDAKPLRNEFKMPEALSDAMDRYTSSCSQAELKFLLMYEIFNRIK